MARTRGGVILSAEGQESDRLRGQRDGEKLVMEASVEAFGGSWHDPIETRAQMLDTETARQIADDILGGCSWRRCPPRTSCENAATTSYLCVTCKSE